jgi:hypothetical protein
MKPLTGAARTVCRDRWPFAPAFQEGRRTMGGKKRKEIYDRVQVMILDNVLHLWLFSADTIDFTQPTTLLYGLEGAWLDKG